MIRRFLILPALAALLVSSADAAQRQLSVTTTELMPGVTYTREVDLAPAGPVVLDVVTTPKPDGTIYSLAPVLSNNSLAGTEKLTDMEKSLDASATTVGIDGDYFNGKTGAPSSILMRGGVLDNQPNPGRSSLGISSDGTLQVAPVKFTATWQGTAGLRPLALNTPTGKFTLYTPAFGTVTPPDSDATEVVLSSFPPSRAGTTLDGTVTQVATSGSTRIPAGGAVLVGRGATNAAQLKTEAPVGEQMQIRLTLAPDWSGLTGAIGGGPLLVNNGKAVFPAGESFPPGLVNLREARGAVGQLADGGLLFVTVEGGNSAYSVGLSSYALALELVKLGAVKAIGLGSGGPAGMAFDGKLLTRPSLGSEGHLSDALVLSYSGVYAPPVAPVLSPNGDGVADTEDLSYQVVRPSTITASVSGPDGATVELGSSTASVGTHTLTWDGRINGALAPEGSWTFTVAATDDRNVATIAQRSFSLDNTLGSLVVTRGPAGGPTASFTLSRAATVVVRVERVSGAVLATVHTVKLVAGANRLSWKGKIGGRWAAAGRYELAVEATSLIGTSSLVAPFSLPAHTRH